MNVNVSLTALEANMLCEEHDKAPTHNTLQLTGFKLDNPDNVFQNLSKIPNLLLETSALSIIFQLSSDHSFPYTKSNVSCKAKSDIKWSHETHF